MFKISVSEKSAGMRLDKFIVQKFSQYPRAHIQKNIKAGHILINDQIIRDPAYKIKQGDKIKAEISKPPQISLRPDPSLPLDVIYEDKDFLIINKPSGIVVHAGVKNPQKTLVNALLAQCPEIATVGDEAKIRPGIVHRLDKDVSGVMVVAKNNKAFQHLKKQFQERKIEKIYICLAWGRFKERKGRIELPIAQNPKHPAKMVVVRNPKDPLNQKTQSALTEYKVLQQFDKTAYLKVYLRTGRRHQIRVHFKSIGHPLVNDPLYGERKQKYLGSGRIFLHAASLGLATFSGGKMHFLSPLPKDLKEILILESRD